MTSSDENEGPFVGAGTEPLLKDVFEDDVLKSVLKRDNITLETLKTVVAEAQTKLRASELNSAA